MGKIRFMWVIIVCFLSIVAFSQDSNYDLKYQGVKIFLEQKAEGSFLKLKNIHCKSIYFDTSFFDFQYSCGQVLKENFGSTYHGTMLMNGIKRLSPFKTLTIKLFNSHPCDNQRLSGRIFWVLKKDLDSYLDQKDKADKNVYTDLIDFKATRVSIELVNDSIKLGYW